MEYIEGLVTAFGTPAIVMAIIAFLIWFTKKHTLEHKVILKRLDDTERTNETIAESLTELYKMSLRSCIVNQNIPISARLELYDIYKAKGFNSWVDKYVEEHLINLPQDQPKRRKTDTMK